MDIDALVLLEKENKIHQQKTSINQTMRNELDGFFYIKDKLQVAREIYIKDGIVKEVVFKHKDDFYYFYINGNKIIKMFNPQDVGNKLSQKRLEETTPSQMETISLGLEQVVYNKKGISEYIIEEYKECFKFNQIKNIILHQLGLELIESKYRVNTIFGHIDYKKSHQLSMELICSKEEQNYNVSFFITGYFQNNTGDPLIKISYQDNHSDEKKLIALSEIQAVFLQSQSSKLKEILNKEFILNAKIKKELYQDLDLCDLNLVIKEDYLPQLNTYLNSFGESLNPLELKEDLSYLVNEIKLREHTLNKLEKDFFIIKELYNKLPKLNDTILSVIDANILKAEQILTKEKESFTELSNYYLVASYSFIENKLNNRLNYISKLDKK